MKAFRKYEVYCKPRKVGEGRYEDYHLSTANEVYEVCKALKMHMLTREKIIALYVDSRTNLIGVVEVSSGTLDSSIVDAKLVFGPALTIGRVAGVILAHNHPSGSLKPSHEDEDMTKMMRDAGKLLGIMVLDHLIVTEDGYYSFAGESRIFRAV